MSTSEERINDLQRHSAVQDARISNLETKFEMFMQSIQENNERRAAEMQDFKNEMRQQNQMRAAENAEIRNEIREINKATDAKIAEIRTTVDGMGKHVRNLTYTSIAAIAAMVITVMLNLPK